MKQKPRESLMMRNDHWETIHVRCSVTLPSMWAVRADRELTVCPDNKVAEQKTDRYIEWMTIVIP